MESESDQFIQLYKSERNGSDEYTPFNCGPSEETCWILTKYAMESLNESGQFIWLYESDIQFNIEQNFE